MFAGTCTTTTRLYHPWRLVTSLALLGLTILGAPASAQTDGDRERALALFREGSSAYREGRFEEASRLFRDAYATFPEPVLLYNLARSEENLGHWDDAADAYEAYLAQAADAEDRPGIERRIVTLRERAAEARAEAQAQAGASELVPEPPPRRELGVPWASIATGIVGLAGIGVAAALGQLALDSWAQARDEQEHLRAVRLEAGANDLAHGANVAYGVAGAVLVAALITLVVELAQ